MANIESKVYKKVRAIVAEQLGVEPDEVRLESSFIDDLGADSLDIVELIMAFEEEFKMEITDEDAEAMSTVQDAVNYLVSGGVAHTGKGDTIVRRISEADVPPEILAELKQ